MRAFITVGLGYGDEGKGATVDFLTRHFKAGLVVRYSGGAQCGHNVVLPNGTQHTFSQFGAGTLAGAHTYLAQPVIVDPLALMNEAEGLGKVLSQLRTGDSYSSNDPMRKLTVHKRCLVTTPLHRMLNRLSELRNQHGTCGMGIGAAREYWLKHGEDAIFVEDLRTGGRLRDKLELFRHRMIIDRSQDLWCETTNAIRACMPRMLRAGNLIQMCDCFEIAAWPVVRQSEAVVFEGAQGMGLDEFYGTHPHTTWSDVTPRYAIEMACASGVQELHVIGCTRTYQTRHGAGPLSYESHGLAIDDPGNPPNEFQGQLRHGELDWDLMRRTVETLDDIGCGLTGFSVSCLDQEGLFEGPPAEMVARFEQLRLVVLQGFGRTHKDRNWKV